MVWLLCVLLVRYKTDKNRCLMLVYDEMITYMGMAVHLAVACDVFDGVLFCAVIFPRNILDKI